MKRAATIETASCSRPARPRKALGACAQSKRVSMVPPTRRGDEGGDKRVATFERIAVQIVLGGLALCSLVAAYVWLVGIR